MILLKSTGGGGGLLEMLVVSAEAHLLYSSGGFLQIKITVNDFKYLGNM